MDELERIRQLMVKSGLSEEAAKEICEGILRTSDAYKAKIDEEYAVRVEAAKKICVEETEAHKLELARRLQVYLEARGAAIDAQLTKQLSVREGDATRLLGQIQAVIEGIPAGGDAAMKAQVGVLQRQVQKLAEERDAAIVKANRQTELCEKVMRRNRLTEARLAELQGDGLHDQPTPIGEDRTAPRPQTPNRQSANRQPPNHQQRLDGGRRGGATRTTRPTLAESQARRQPIDRRTAHVSSGTPMPNAAMTPDQIAAGMEDTP